MLRVLHIDDDAWPKELIKAHLGMFNTPTEVVFATNEKEALDNLKNFKYDLIILDGNIPGWVGHVAEVQNYTATEIVMYSSESSDKMKKYLSSGAKQAFDKGPEGTKALVEYIRSMIKA